MKTTSVTAHPREDFTKAAIKALRKDKKVPGAVYSEGKAHHIYIDYKEAKEILFTQDTFIIEVEVEGNKKNTIVREAQYHPITDKIIHVDLLEVLDNKPVEVVLPINFVGSAKGVLDGGIILIKLRKLKVKGLTSNLPDVIEVDITDLELGSSYKVSDLELDGIQIISNSSTAIVSIEVPRALKSADAELEGEEGEEGEEGAEGEEGTEESGEE